MGRGRSARALDRPLEVTFDGHRQPSGQMNSHTAPIDNQSNSKTHGILKKSARRNDSVAPICDPNLSAGRNNDAPVITRKRQDPEIPSNLHGQEPSRKRKPGPVPDLPTSDGFKRIKSESS